ncbi:MAG: rRNA pseudouridine synthase [Nitrosomonas sp.]|nr:MAG: rRNA pseudouridine synthase [Nitrosomonas sp.]
MTEENFVRLSKLMTLRGICSRREADHYIEAGQVYVNGEIVNVLGTKVAPNVTIHLGPMAEKRQEGKVTILLNKPVGYVSTQPEKGYLPAVDLITDENWVEGEDDPFFRKSHLVKLACAGRLDIDSKGLLVFTQDGVLVKRLIGPGTEIEKEYVVYVEGQVTEGMLKALRFGLYLDDKPLKRARVDMLQPNLLRFVLKEGRKRQIRRMCEIVGLAVTGLKRVRVGGVRLGDLPEGKWRYLRPNERF